MSNVRAHIHSAVLTRDYNGSININAKYRADARSFEHLLWF